MAVPDERLDQALIRLTGSGPEFGEGLSNHGPMAAEALVALGRGEAVDGWVDRYLRRLDEAPRGTAPIDDDNWRAALSDLRRVADWTEYLHRQLREEPWQRVLGRWWQRLLPGMAAAATHGVIRTAHAARGLAQAHSPTRVQELANGLAYWAARYLEVPGVGRKPGEATAGGQLRPGHALAAVPTLPDPGDGLITDQFARLGGLSGFPEAVAALRPAAADVDVSLHELTREFATNYLRNGGAAPIPFIHTVTAPTAVRSILSLLPGSLHRPTHDALWQVGAAIHAGYAGGGAQAAAGPPPPRGALPAPDDLTDRAVAVGDEHAIKFIEACLREWHHAGEQVYLRAADLALTNHFDR